MRTDEGWVRGRLCGKRTYHLPGDFECAMCGRRGDKVDLCYPVKED